MFWTSIVLTALLARRASNIFVDAHGYLESPRSRNFYAYEFGPSCSGDGCPPAEYCYHCLNTNEGACGSFNGRSYDTSDWVDQNGSSMPWMNQGTYLEGQNIFVRSYLSTHHNGHMEIRACKYGPACDNDNDDDWEDLTFVRDVLYDMPKDTNYPERGMYAGGRGGGIQSFEMEFQLPMGISGSQVLLQWKYITANSCSPPGYSEYFGANPELPDSYWNSELTLCTLPYPSDGTRGTTWPEQFFNCAEVSITSLAPTTPTPTKQPTPPPTTGPTSTKAPTVTPQCIAEWDQCTYDWEGCCEGFVCKQVDTTGYGRCLVNTCSEGPPSPTPPSPTPPTAGDYCCYDRNSGYQTCSADSWCNAVESQCDTCGGVFSTSPVVQTGCCSWGGDCSGDDPNSNPGCHYLQTDCEGSCGGAWQAL